MIATAEQPTREQQLMEAWVRAQAGARLLDREMPGWRDGISLRELDVRMCEDCVLGQLYGSYSEGLSEIDLEEVWDCPEAFGFDRWTNYGTDDDGDGDPHPEYDALNAAWRLVVRGLPA